ncbi:KH domain-containing protein [Bdellovibrio sp. KM01]|uniref:KH domain-containing protein n=1 Tax=Bdellovibrio sp. KM01 TaxID=2748865 RepID=UPI0015EAD565|nr:KH domain-containing protein [Bdellovibrio sp. KM01]QLY23948.1 KH domain-containing protein [Bdellovibrio sp. KM01]
MEKKIPTIIVRKPQTDSGSKSGAEDTGMIDFIPNKNEIIEKTRIKLEEILKLIVDFPEEISVTVTQGERTTIFNIDCSKRNFGRMLGSRGKMIGSLRNVILAMTARHGIRSIIEVPYFSQDMKPLKQSA